MRMSLTEALDKLELYELTDYVCKEFSKMATDTHEPDLDYYNDNYDDVIDGMVTRPEFITKVKARYFPEYCSKEELNNYKKLTEAELLESKSAPAIGDIAFLKIKLNDSNAINKDKNIYAGFERRPIVILNFNSNNTVDGLEVTHSNKLGKNSINIGQLKNNSANSYVTVSSKSYHKGLELSYEFPYMFKEDNKPLTKAEFVLEFSGKLYNNNDKDEPFMVEFNYNDNYMCTISDDDLNKILNAAKCLIESEK